MDALTAYGNDPHTYVFGVNPVLVAIAAEALMPPQFDEFCKAMRGECSEKTNDYWAETAEKWTQELDEQIEERKNR
jgi:hypothetical protein